MKDWKKIIAELEAVLKANPRAELMTSLSHAYAQAGDLEAAEKECARSLSLNPSEKSSHLRKRAEIREKRGNLRGAREDLLAAAETEKNDSALWSDLAALESRLGENESSLAHFSAAVRLQPDDWRPLLDRGTLQFIMARYKEAEADFSAVLAKIAGNENILFAAQQAHLHRGWCRYVLKIDGALEDLNEAVRLDPRDATALCYRGMVRVLFEDPDAPQDYEEAIRLDPTLARAYVLRGDFQLQVRGDKKSALRDYDKALELSPELRDSLRENIERAKAQPF